MCFPKKVNPVQPIPVNQNQTADRVVLKQDTTSGLSAKRRGTSSLRIDRKPTGPNVGLNLPT